MLLVLDATTGQNAIQQVRVFKEMVDVTGLVVTKLDGSARGGVVVALAEEFGLPVHAVGVGEQAGDLTAIRRSRLRAGAGRDGVSRSHAGQYLDGAIELRVLARRVQGIEWHFDRWRDPHSFEALVINEHVGDRE